MIKRELAKDPKLANESWDRFLPQFRKKHLSTSEKTAKKNEHIQTKAQARQAAGLDPDNANGKKEKKVYTPFPPPQQPSKARHPLLPQGLELTAVVLQVDLQLESGEYFLKPYEKKRREENERKQKVSIGMLAGPSLLHECHHSKRRPQRNGKPSAPRHISPQPRRPFRLLRRSANGNEGRFR
jgi:hypothetical protein